MSNVEDTATPMLLGSDLDLSKLPEHVALRTETGALVILIGTAHISEQSCKDVASIIQATKPQQVLVELCPARVAIIDPDHINKLYRTWKEQHDAPAPTSSASSSTDTHGEQGSAPTDASHAATQRKGVQDGASQEEADHDSSTRPRSGSMVQPGDVSDVSHEKHSSHHDEGRFKALTGAWDRQGGILAVAISYMYESISDQVKLHVGDDMRIAAEEAAKIGATIVLGDRPIGITLARAWSGLTAWQKLKLGLELIKVSFSSVKAEDLEMLKNKDILTDLIKELSLQYPSLYTHLLQERDLYLAHKLRSLPGPIAVGVVGLGHVEGIQKHWKDFIDVPAIMIQPPSSSWKAFFAKVALSSVFIFGAFIALLYMIFWK